MQMFGQRGAEQRASRTWQNKWSTARQTAAAARRLTPKNKFFLPAVSHPRANFFLSIQQQPAESWFSFHSLFIRARTH